MNDELNKKEEKQEVTVSDVAKAVQGGIDNLQNDLGNKFEDLREAIVVSQPTKSHFIVKNKFWDQWFQKLFSQLLSVKIWVMALVTVLLSMGLISNMQFASILGIIMGLKGVFSTAAVWKQDKSNIIDRV